MNMLSLSIFPSRGMFNINCDQNLKTKIEISYQINMSNIYDNKIFATFLKILYSYLIQQPLDILG